jgi:hypothetical protein
MNAHAPLVSPLTFNPNLDIATLAETFRTKGHVRIPHVLTAGAPELYRHFEANDCWMQVLNRPGGGAYEMPLLEWQEPGSQRRTAIEKQIHANACDGFQYSYAALRIPAQDEACSDPVLCQIGDMLADPAVLQALTAITGIARPLFTDGQVTSYGHGDFLTGHDDDLAGSGRAAAFVLGLTPQWRLEWGGLLMFHELGEVPFWGLAPQFNTLDLFAVPKYHSVSLISPAAPRRRFSITGWLSQR